MMAAGHQRKAPDQMHGRGNTEGRVKDGDDCGVIGYDIPSWAATTMGKSSNTVIDTSCIECGHILVNHLLCLKVPKPTEPAASEATKKSGREEMEGMRNKLTPSQQ